MSSDKHRGKAGDKRKNGNQAETVNRNKLHMKYTNRNRECMKEKELSEQELEARRAYQREWRKAHRDRVRVYQQRYRARHVQEVREYKRQWYSANKEKVKEYNRRYWQKRAAENGQAE